MGDALQSSFTLFGYLHHYWSLNPNRYLTVNKPKKSHNQVLRINVGFLLKEGAGYNRTVTFDSPGHIEADDFLITDLRGDLRLTRTPQGVLVQGTLQAKMRQECVRCLTAFEFPYEVEFSELFVPEEMFDQADADPLAEPSVITEDGVIDLTPIMREEGILAIPMQALCKPDCKGLCAQCGQNLNEGACDCETEPIDPRLAPLRALLEDLEEEE